ncbi:SDR family oxidoreductase [Niveispirillum sp. SYP-B3756]|uniref:SDR family oxidoreductase n=1 Tax=Niveispirillum sp. SYP-B3756 TaxID=2662178 RepID=UPI0012914700|nr:SDR family oxidoreductase [Niveispirillum sp. SYP-B3756]MQP68615.1 SDR family oxidoreductase [Niveispirillum sp. SYP-B3756]
MGRLEGKIAFVTGGASGLGRAIVERFVEEGAKVFLGDMKDEIGQQIAASTGATFLHLDVTREDQWIAAMRQVTDASGRLDVMVNNAGILGPGALETIEIDAWNRLFAVNVTGVMLGCKHGALAMQKNPGGPSGSIINMSSNAGILATATDPGYSATKGAVRLMTKSIAVNFARRGIPIRCNSIHPGPIDTPIFEPWRRNEDTTALLMKKLHTMTPMGRIGRPLEIANMALFLASDESSFSTGSEFVADGGGTAALHGE